LGAIKVIFEKNKSLVKVGAQGAGAFLVFGRNRNELIRNRKMKLLKKGCV
jgi:hypothetical protein